MYHLTDHQHDYVLPISIVILSRDRMAQEYIAVIISA